MDNKHKSISYAKWGYIFIAPFIIVFILCQLIPLFSTFYNSFFENYMDGLNHIGPNFVGFDNYVKLFTPSSNGKISILSYTWNTMFMWILGAVPQLVFSLLLAVIFTSARLNVKGQTFFKTVIYMPNLVMASAFSMLFYTLFSNVGPVNQIIMSMTNSTFDFFLDPMATRSIIAFINFLMWFGNTTILLMAGIMGIDQSLFEAASIDGATKWQQFKSISVPLVKPTTIYVLTISIYAGLSMFLESYMLWKGNNSPQNIGLTIVGYLYRQGIEKRAMGYACAVGLVLLIIVMIINIIQLALTGTFKKEER